MKGEIRIGTVSSVDGETGMVSVIYQDRDGEVTQMLPYATFNDEYKQPRVGAKVLVAHLSSGNEMGVVLGTYWNKSNPAGNPGAYHKELGGGAYLDYKEGVLTIAAESLQLVSQDGDGNAQAFNAASLMEEVEGIKGRLAALEQKV